MAICRRCGADHPPEELIRHELPGLTLVHCPDCRGFMGRYRRHGDAPRTDRR
ncbi:hypothetical protein [Haloprofundus halobius]|uniref:hypothetical protein n=1 Tax=Haloprofundus halobius TaxID=2876194 RepID=UPI001CCE8515|nr:hypothetical protein [Haloprofundus halobius]